MDYDVVGRGYAAVRRPDPRIGRRIDDALGSASTVLNVGAGAGAYEPVERDVIAVEPSALMISQRSRDAAPTVRAAAEHLPFSDGAFDAAMALFTVHHWSDVRMGLREMARVARRVLILTWDQDALDRFWLERDYLPGLAAYDRRRAPGIDGLVAMLRPGARRMSVPIPWDCSDGFLGAYWRRPEAYLDPTVRAGISSLVALGSEAEPGLSRLARDLENGRWRRRNAHLLELDEYDVGYRLIVA